MIASTSRRERLFSSAWFNKTTPQRVASATGGRGVGEVRIDTPRRLTPALAANSNARLRRPPSESERLPPRPVRLIEYPQAKVSTNPTTNDQVVSVNVTSRRFSNVDARQVTAAPNQNLMRR